MFRGAKTDMFCTYVMSSMAADVVDDIVILLWSPHQVPQNITL